MNKMVEHQVGSWCKLLIHSTITKTILDRVIRAVREKRPNLQLWKSRTQYEAVTTRLNQPTLLPPRSSSWSKCRSSRSTLAPSFKQRWQASSPIPDICQFWYTLALFKPVKVYHQFPKIATKQPKLAKIGQNFGFTMPKSTPAWKKYNTDGREVTVVANISYAVL